MTVLKLTPAAALLTLLAACGGGDDAPSGNLGAGSSAAATNITTITPPSGSAPASGSTGSTSTSTSTTPQGTGTGTASSGGAGTTGGSGAGSSGGSTSGSDASGTDTGGNTGTGTATPPTTTDRIAMIVALPMPAGQLSLSALADKGHAGGQVDGRPFTVSERNAAVANADNFYTGESTTAWTTQVGGMNADGVLAGSAAIGTSRTFGWTWNGAAITKFEPPAGFSIDSVVGPSNDGRIAANLRSETAQMKAVIYGGGAPIDIPTLVPVTDGPRPFTMVQAMSGNGTIAGITRRELLGWEHIFTFSSGAMRDLGRLTDCNCNLVTVNDNGYVLGAPRKMGPFGMLFNGTDRIQIGAPRSGNYNVNVFDSNDRNDVVGSYWLPDDGSTSRPLVFLGGQSYDLNDYTQASRLGWTLNTASRINNNRQILGEGTYQGQTRWYRLSLR